MPFASADGLRIAYSDAGDGSALPIVCLTGWCSSRARYHGFVQCAATARRVLTVDWRGHGESDVPPGDFGLDELVRDVLAVVEETGLTRFALASASHSGWVAIELRRRLGERIPCLVHMDWLVLEPSEQYLELLRGLQAEETWREARDRLFEIWRGGVREQAIEEAIAVMKRQGAAMWMRSGREIEGCFARHRSALASLSALDSQPRVLHLYGQPADPDYLARQQAFAAEHGWFDVHRASARSHFTMIETPDEAVAAVNEFLGF
jgi:pimeloyl-ACP methyl ester carboxylesterase